MLTLALIIFAVQRLTPLLGECDRSPSNHMSCDSDIYRPVWRILHSATGEIIKIDTAQIDEAGTRGATVFVYISPPGASFEPRRLRRLFFNCQGEYSDVADLEGMMDAPPGSVAGGIAALVCPIAGRLHGDRIRRDEKRWGIPLHHDP